MNFNELDWHDAVIRNIQIDRRDPGNNDTILFDIIWPNQDKNKIIFHDIYWTKMTLGFGIVAEECVAEAFIAEKDDQDLNLIYDRWSPLIGNIELTGYIIKTSSTGSEIKIIAKGFKLIK